MPKKAKKVKTIEIEDETPETHESVPVPPTPAPKKKRAPRKPTAYNLFMREKMQSKEIKKMNPKERFGAVAKLWKDRKA